MLGAVSAPFAIAMTSPSARPDAFLADTTPWRTDGTAPIASPTASMPTATPFRIGDRSHRRPLSAGLFYLTCPASDPFAAGVETRALCGRLSPTDFPRRFFFGRHPPPKLQHLRFLSHYGVVFCLFACFFLFFYGGGEG